MTETTMLDLATYPKGIQSGGARELFDSGYDVLFGTGTESESLLRVMRVLAYENDYALLVRPNRWVAIHKELIVPGTYLIGHDEEATWIGCEIKGLGQVAFLVPAEPPSSKRQLSRLAKKLGAESEFVFSGGEELVFYDKKGRTTRTSSNKHDDRVEASFSVKLPND